MTNPSAEAPIPVFLAADIGAAAFVPERLPVWRRECARRLSPSAPGLLLLSAADLLRGAGAVLERIVRARTLSERLALASFAQDWFRASAEPRLRAWGSGFSPASVGVPPTGSAAAWEGFLIACLRAFGEALAERIGGDSFIRSSAQYLLPDGEAAWRADGFAPSRLRGAALVVASAHLLAHTHASSRSGGYLSHGTSLLPPDDPLVWALAIAAHPGARFAALAGAPYPAGFRGVLPSGTRLELWDPGAAGEAVPGFGGPGRAR